MFLRKSPGRLQIVAETVQDNLFLHGLGADTDLLAIRVSLIRATPITCPETEKDFEPFVITLFSESEVSHGL